MNTNSTAQDHPQWGTEDGPHIGGLWDCPCDYCHRERQEEIRIEQTAAAKDWREQQW